MPAYVWAILAGIVAPRWGHARADGIRLPQPFTRQPAALVWGASASWAPTPANRLSDLYRSSKDHQW